MLSEEDLETELDRLEGDILEAYIEDKLLPMCREAKDMGEVYEDRNVAVFGFLRQLKTLKELSQAGSATLHWDIQVGYRENTKTDGGWVAVFAMLPEGQVSWTVKREDVPDWLEEKDVDYDGHSVEEKLDRVRSFSHIS